MTAIRNFCGIRVAGLGVMQSCGRWGLSNDDDLSASAPLVHLCEHYELLAPRQSLKIVDSIAKMNGRKLEV